MYKAFETYRGLVNPWSIDHVGHMNVQFYTARFDEASWQFSRTAWAYEVFAGTLLHIASELLVLGTKSLEIIHRMYKSPIAAEHAVMRTMGQFHPRRHGRRGRLPGMFELRYERSSWRSDIDRPAFQRCSSRQSLRACSQVERLHSPRSKRRTRFNRCSTGK